MWAKNTVRLYLLKEAKDIKMTEIIRTLEGPIAMLPCVSLNYYEKCDDCPDEEACSVHKLMIQVRDNTLNDKTPPSGGGGY
mgnify:CR=1 FL=1